MSGLFRMWVNSFADPSTELWQLEGDGDTALYKSHRKGASPVFHVWIDGEWVCSSMNYRTAYEIFEKNRKQERELNTEDSQKGE